MNRNSIILVRACILECSLLKVGLYKVSKKWKEGRKEGRKEGGKEGGNEGRNEGRTEGRKEGRKERR